MYNKYPQRPVLQCEEFECETAPKDKVIKRERPPENKTDKIEKKDEDKYKGLCSDCENRKECILSKLEGGVWHCEEYK